MDLWDKLPPVFAEDDNWRVERIILFLNLNRVYTEDDLNALDRRSLEETGFFRSVEIDKLLSCRGDSKQRDKDLEVKKRHEISLLELELERLQETRKKLENKIEVLTREQSPRGAIIENAANLASLAVRRTRGRDGSFFRCVFSLGFEVYGAISHSWELNASKRQLEEVEEDVTRVRAQVDALNVELQCLEFDLDGKQTM